jgi:hypothetical protein
VVADPLAPLVAKLDRADESLRALDDKLSGVANGKPLRIGIDVDFQSGWNTAYIEHAKPLPVDASVLVGESLYHGRSTLEHLVWALVKANHKKPGKHNTFPIATEGTTARFLEVTNRPREGRRRPGALRGVPKQARALIESLQPYNRSNPSDHWLSVLNQMARDDRHHALHASYAVVWDDGARIRSLFHAHRGYEITQFRDLTRSRRSLVSDAKLARFRVKPLTRNPKVSVKGDLPVHIAFGGDPRVLLDSFKTINRLLRDLIEPVCGVPLGALTRLGRASSRAGLYRD